MIEIKSFSFLHTPQQIPLEQRKNLWYIFDCRCITDPVLIPELKNFHGLDMQIQLFFKKETNMIQYLEGIYKNIYLVLNNYLRDKKSIEKVTFNFGCLGGIHRSVFAAEYITKKIRQDFPGEKILLEHTRNIKKNSLL